MLMIPVRLMAPTVAMVILAVLASASEALAQGEDEVEFGFTFDLETVEDDNRCLRMNIDKGNQAGRGESIVVLGYVAHTDVVNDEHRVKTLDKANRPMSIETDGEGRLWLIVGADSGLEGLRAFLL